MMQEAAERGEEAFGFAHVSTPAIAQHDRSPRRGVGTDELEDAPLLGKNAAAPASGVFEGKKTPSPDEDRDVRELESMLMGLEAEEELDNNVPVVQLAADGEEVGLAAAAAADNSVVALPRIRDREGEGGALLASEAGQNLPRVGRHSPVAFTIEEDGNDGNSSISNDPAEAPTTLGVSPSLSPAASAAAAAASAADLESTRELLGSITATLNPSATDGGNGEVVSESGALLRVTRSELALVNLMEEAGEEPGGLSEAVPLRPPGDNNPESTPVAGEVSLSRSGFDDALSAGSAALAAGDGDAGMNGGGTSGSGSGGVGGSGPRPGGAAASHERVGSSGGGNGSVLEGLGKVPGRTNSAPRGTAAAAEQGRALNSLSGPRAGPVFSLGHDRWVTCGFTSVHTVGRGGQDAASASVGRALRDASSVLALDNVNYFMAR